MNELGYAGVFQHYLALAAPYLERYGYAAVFFGVFVESFGVPAPGESLIIAGALLSSQGRMHIWLLLPIACSAAILGDNIGYAIGYYGGRRLILHRGRHIGIKENHLQKVERFFARFGPGIVMAARFFEVLRQLNGIVAGFMEMPWWRFLAYNAIGAVLWVGVWGFGVYMLGAHAEEMLALIKRAQIYVIIAGLAVLAAVALYLIKQIRPGQRPKEK